MDLLRVASKVLKRLPGGGRASRLLAVLLALYLMVSGGVLARTPLPPLPHLPNFASDIQRGMAEVRELLRDGYANQADHLARDLLQELETSGQGDSPVSGRGH